MRMTGLPVVKRLDVFKNSRPGLLPGVVKVSADQLHLQSVEETLRHGVVPAVAFPADADPDSAGFQQRLKLDAGVLTPPVGRVNPARFPRANPDRHG